MIDFYLDKIQLRNVRCYGDDIMEMDFPVNNLTVFTGRVGAGKSTIFKAISMALYGEDGGAKNEKLSIDDLLNEKNGKNLEIHLYFHSTKDNENEETKYEIHLFHKHSKYNNKLVFIKNGKDISLASKTETYDLIERTLIPSGVYHNTYYFTQQCKNFFTSLSNSEQKDIFNSILDLSEYKCYYDNTKTKLDEDTVKLQMLNNELISQKSTMDSFHKMLNDSKTNLENVKEQTQVKLENLYLLNDDLKQSIDRMQSEMPDNVDDELNRIEMEYQKNEIEHKNFIDNINKEIFKIESDFTNTTVTNLKNKYVRIRLERSKDMDSDLNTFKIELQKTQSSIDNLKKDIDIQKLNDIEDQRVDYDKKIGKLTETINTHKSNCDKLEKEWYAKMTKLVEDGQRVANEYKTNKSNLESEKLKLEVYKKNVETSRTDAVNKISEYKNALMSDDAVCSLCGQKLNNKDHIKKHIDQLEKDLETLNYKCSGYEREINQCDDNINEINNKLENLRSEFVDTKKTLTDEFENSSKEIKETISILDSDKKKLMDEFENVRINITDKYNKDFDVKSSTLSNEKKTLEGKISKIMETKENLDTQLREDYKSNYAILLQDKDKEIKNLNTKLQMEDSEYNERKTQLKKSELSIKNVKDEIEQFNSKIRSMEDTIIKNNKEIETLESSKTTEELEKSINKIQETIKNGQEKYDGLQKNIKEYKNRVDVLTFWKTAFSDNGIKSMLMDAAIPHMNECVGAELDRVTPGKFTVSFDTLSETKSGKIKDKFSVNIVNNDKGSTGHKKLSGGEKRIIDLCCMSALRSLAEKLYGKRFHHIFYDEILDSLDDECKQAFCANVKYQSQNGCNITLITHDMPEDVEPDRVFPF